MMRRANSTMPRTAASGMTPAAGLEYGNCCLGEFSLSIFSGN